MRGRWKSIPTNAEEATRTRRGGVSESRSFIGPRALCRTELFGRILLSKEFGVTRQKLYVCSKSKVVRSKKATSLNIFSYCFLGLGFI